MPAPSERGSIGELDAGREWLGNSLWQAPKADICWVKSWPAITAVSYHRDGGETIWRGDRPRLVLALHPLPPVLVQVEQGPTWQTPPAASGSFGFFPADLTVRVVHGAARSIQVLWDTDLYSSLLPELGAAASHWELQYPMQDPLLSQIVMTLAQETESGLADKILVESLGTAFCIRIAQRFVGRLPLPTSNGLSHERVQRVREYVEAHLGDRLTLADLAGVACLSPYHFSRSFKLALGIGPQRYVVQRRLERAKTLMRRTNQPLAWVAQEAGFADQSHLTSVFRRETGMTPGRFRAALA